MPDARPLVLLVDDQPLNLKVLATALNRDCAVQVATNGPEALAQ
jgi:CheY-like chemotaxis protein